MGGGKGGSDFNPKGTLGQRGDEVLPVVHDRTCSATSDRTPTSRQATSASAAVRSASCSDSTSACATNSRGTLTGKGRDWGGSAAAPRSDGLRHLLLRTGDARHAQGVVQRQDRLHLGIGQRGTVCLPEGDATRCEGRDALRFVGLHPRPRRHRRGKTGICNGIEKYLPRTYQGVRRPLSVGQVLPRRAPVGREVRHRHAVRHAERAERRPGAGARGATAACA